MRETQCWIQINDESDIVRARQLGRELTTQLDFGNVDQVRIITAISELARNIYLYAPGGEIRLLPIHRPYQTGIVIFAKDHGPGIENIRKVLEDGYSTSGGLGAGLPGVKRMMDNFSIRSEVGVGTEIEVTKWLHGDVFSAYQGTRRQDIID